MNEEAIKDAYTLFSQGGYNGSIENFKKLISTNGNALKDAHDIFSQGGYNGDINDFKALMGIGASKQEPLKKKEPTVSASKLEKPTSVSSSKKVDVKAPVKKEDKFEVYKGSTGKEDKEYRFDTKTNTWYETKLLVGGTKQAGKEMLSSGATVRKETTPQLNLKSEYVQITNPSRVAELNRYFKKQASTSKGEKIFVGYPGKEANEYKVDDNGVWMKRPQGKDTWSVVTNEGSVGALNRQFGKDIDPKKADLQQIAAKNSELNSLNHKIDSYVTSSLVDDREGAVVSVLSKQFPQFKFEEAQAGADRMTVSLRGSNRPEDKITIMLDNWRDSEDASEAQRLRSFMKERANMADSRINLEKKEGYFIDKETQRRQQAIATGMGERDFAQPELKINKDGSVSYATEPTTKPGETTMKDWEAKQQLMTARKEYIADKSSYMKSLKNSYERGDIDRKQFGSAVAAIKVDDEEIKRHDNFVNDVNLRRKDLVQSEKFQEDYIADVEAKLKSGEITQEQYDTEYKNKIAGINQRVEEKREELKLDDKNLNVSLKAMNVALGENRLIQEQIGSTGGVMVYNFLKGATNLGRFAGMTAEDQDEFIRELTGIMTTEEWMASKDRTFLQEAAMSTTSSLGAAATKFIPIVGQVAYVGNLFSLGFFEMKDELDNATYKNPETGKVEKLNIPAEQKLLMSAGFGVVSYYLEKLGLDELLTGKMGKKLAMTVVKDVAKKIAKDSPKEFIENALISETKSRLMQAGVNLGTGMLTEGATEALQSLANVSTKEIYDSLAEKEYFNNKSGWEIASDVFYEGALGTAGGGMVSGAITGAQLTAQQRRESKYKNEINAMIAAAETEGASQAIITTLKAKVIKGELTAPEAKQIVRDFTIVKSKVDQMPNDLSEQGKAASLDLMMEKDKLEKTIQGKDPNLVKPQKDRIAEIDKRLQEIAKENAVQEQATSEVPLQPEAGVGGEVAQGTPETTTEQVTEEGEQAVEEEVVQETLTEEERQALIDDYVTTQTEAIENAYGDNEELESAKQEVLAELEADPIAFAQSGNSQLSIDFLNQLGINQETQQKAVAETAPVVEEEQLAPEVQQELDTFEQLLADEGLAFEEVVDEEAAAVAPEVEEEVVVPAPPSRRGRGVSSKTPTQAAAATAPSPAPSPAPAKKKTKKQLATEAKERFIADIDDKIKREKNISDRRLADLKNQRDRAYRNGNRQLGIELADKIEDEILASKKRLAELQAKKDNPSAFARFRKRSESDVESQDERNDREIIAQHMEETLSEEDKALESPESMSSQTTIDPIKESKSLSKSISKVLKFLGIKDKNELLLNIEDLKGIPFGMAMSDALAAGDIVDSMGNKMNVGGGMLFNLFNNIKLAWAGVKESDSDKMHNENYDIYIGNKELFDRLWAEGRLPYGHVPIAVMRMGNTAINSNEAVFRYALPYIQSLPLENRKAALQELLNQFESRAKGQSSTYWKNELSEAISNGEVKTEKELKSYIEKLANDETNTGRADEAKKFLKKVEDFEKSGIENVFEKTNKLLEEEINSTASAKMSSYINNNNIETLDGFFEAIIKESNERAKGVENDFSLPTRAFLFNLFFSAESEQKGKTKTNKLAVIKTLLNGVENAKNEIFTADHIYKAIGEPAMQKTKQGDFVAVMGVKVVDENGNKAGGTVKADHANYGFGPEGRLIGYIRNPKQGIDVFPEFRAKLARVFKQDKKNNYPTFESAVQQTGGNFFIDSAFRGAKAKFGEITDMDVLIGKLRFAFPEVQVVDSQEEFDKFMAEEEGVRTREKDGEVIYGVTKNGRIFINPSYQSLRTPIHEFGHVWIDFLRSKASGEVGDMLLKKGFELVDGTPEYKRALKEYGDRELALEEALVELMATKGDTLIGAAKTRFKNWMNAVFKYIKQQFTTNTKILTKLYKDKKNPDNARKAIDYINQMSLDEFINIGLADLFSGERVSDKFDARTAESASKARKSKQNIANKIVEIGRDKGISDAVIKESLKKRGYTNAQINEALAAQPDTTVAPNEALNDFIDSINTVVKEYAAAARKKVRADLKAKRAVLAAKLKAMQTSGNITSKQAQALLEKVNKLNLSNSVAVDRFMQFAENVFKNAEYVESLSTINRLLPAARRNVKSKLGIANDLVPMLQSMLAVKPSFIPMSVFDTYKSIIDIVGQRQAELELPEISELINKVQEVTEAIDVESGLAADLMDRLENYPDKVMDNGKLQYTETINKMLEDGIINEYDLSVMKKYRSMIAPTERAKKSEQELKDERDQAIVDLRSEPVDASTLPTRDERNLATKLAAFLKTDALESLSNQELNDLLKIVDNINNGFITNRAQMLVEKMDGIIKRDNLLGPIGRIKVMLGERLKSGAKKALFRKKGNFYKYILEGNSSAFIDEVFGNFKERPFYDNIFKPIGQALSAFTAENRVVSDRIVAMEKRLAKAFGRNENKITMSKFKMMTWLIQNEFESNPNSRQVNPAIEFLKKTIKETKAERTYYSAEDVKMFEKIINDYQDVMKDENGDPILDKDGNEVMGIDMNKMFDSFNTTEKNILAEIRTINDMMSEKAEYTAAIVRGSRITPIANYISLGVINSETRNDQLDSINELRNVFGNSRTTSTRAKTLIERTGKVSAINFDPFSSVRRSASSVLMDYHLTPAVRQGRFTMRELEKAVDNNEITEDKLPLVTALDAAFTQIVDTAVGNTFMSEGMARGVINEISRQGYRAVLAGIPRMASEAMSNMAYILMKGSRSWALGASYGKLLMSPDAFNVLKNVNSIQTNRIYSSSTVSSQLAASEIFNQTAGIRGSQAKGVVANAAKTIYNKSLKRLKNTTETTADLLMSTPDMVMIRPLWFGEFARQFKKETGADVDFEKIANNDEAYIAKYQDAINKSKDTADDTTVKAGASDNIALGILRNTIKPDDNEVAAWYKKFNSYMGKFLLFEYQTARSGINMLMKGNKLDKAEGVALIAAVTARMMVYQLATRTLANGFVDLVAGLLGYRDDEDEEEEDDKTVMQRVGQAIASTMTTLLFGRNFGNAARVPINYGIEIMNKEYLESLRDGEYDMYEDAIQYSLIPMEKPKGDTGKGVDLMDSYINTLGSMTPAVKTLRYLGMKLTEDDKKREDAIERQKKERTLRVPMEIAGSLGYLPLYKDVRKITMDYIYGDINKVSVKSRAQAEDMISSAKSSLKDSYKEIAIMESNREISSKEAREMIESAEIKYTKKVQGVLKALEKL